MRTRLAALLVLTVAAAVACAGPTGSGTPTGNPTATDGGSRDPGATATASSPSPAALLGVRYACGQVPFDPAVLDQSGMAEIDADPVAEVLRQVLATEQDVPGSLPMNGWIVVGESPVLVEFVARRVDGQYAFVTVEQRDGRWQAGGWGGCRPVAVLEGLSLATWNYAPDEAEPLPDTTTFDAVVNERACTGGQEMGERLQPPMITYGATEITIIVAARPLPGGHDCPGNPSTRVTVVLDEPLGERVLRDGAYYPSNDPAVIAD
jgi:hypothetical protein